MMNNSKTPDPTTTSDLTVEAPAASPATRPRGRPKGGKTRPLARPYERAAVPALLDVREAADALRCSVEALRARCRRAAVVDADGNVTAPLAPGIVAVKFGANTWRVRFDAK